MDLQPLAKDVETDDRIAIVGLGACLPDAPNVAQFWANICRGHVAIGEVPPERWSQATYYDVDRSKMDRTYSRIGGFIRYDPFDPRQFRLVPKSLPAIDDLQKMALVAVAEALQHAGLRVFAKDEAGFAFNRERCATIFGNTMGGEAEDRTSLRVWLLEVEDALVRSALASGKSEAEARAIADQLHADYAPVLPKLTEDSMPGELSNCITGRIANVFDLCGANFTTDAACASTMAAVQAGVTGLRNHEFDTAVVGGADRSMDPPTFVKFCRIGALSPDRSTPFDAEANGFVMGEGVGVLVLKRYADAVAEGLPVLATIRAIGASSDGRGKGMTAPNPRGQRLAVERAWTMARRSLADVGLIEAHGTSTAVGDTTELGVLDELLAGQAQRHARPIPVGSVKSMIGHLKSASGAASLIKATLALHHRRLPPSAGFKQASAHSPLQHGRLAVQTEDAPWPQPAQGPRLAGVSSFGFGGTNFHVVLEEASAVAQDNDQALPRPAAHVLAASGGQAAAATSAGAKAASPQAMLAAVTALFAEQTGYATEELEPSHHLEADLGIDSVKQAEIMAILRQRYGIDAQTPAKLAELSTLESIAAYLARHQSASALGGTAGAPASTDAAAATAAGMTDAASAPAPGAQKTEAAGASAPIGPTIFAFGGATLDDAVAAGRAALAAGQAAWLAARQSAHKAAGRIAFVASSSDEALARLADVAQKGSRGARLLAAKGIFVAEGQALAEGGQLAFLFPGQGSQYLGMLQDLAASYPVVAETFAEADRILRPLLGQTLTDIVWPSARDEAHELALRRTEICQPAMLTADVALARLLAQFGVAPQVVVGHSLGEYAATVVAGVLSFADALYAVSARGREMAGVKVDDPGKMAMVAADADRVEAVLAGVSGYVIAANKNCHTQTVIAGGSQAVDAALAAFAGQGIEARPIAVSHAFHSAIVAPAAEPLRRVLQNLAVRAPTIPLSSNVDAALYPADPAAIVDRLAQQLASPVRFIEQVENLWQGGARIFVEVGPKRAITGFVRNILGTRSHHALACNHPKKSGEQGVLETLAALTVDGIAVRFAGRPDGDRPAKQVLAREASAEALLSMQPTQGNQTTNGAHAGHVSGTAQAAGPAQSVEPTQPVEPAQPRGSASAPLHHRIVVSGTSVLLPGQQSVCDWRNDPYAALLRGDNFIAPVPQQLRQQIADKKIVRLEKASGRFVTLPGADDVLHHAARMGALDLTAWGIEPGLTEAMDATGRLTVAAGLDALRDAGLPLVQHWRTTSTGSRLPDRWGLPTAVGSRTGVILASAFSSLDAVLREVRHEAERRQTGAAFDRKWLFRALPMGHAQLAQLALAQGPNSHINAACASGTQALAMASDWIRLGRCDRVIVVTADDIAQDDALRWIGAGFLAAGAASVEPSLAESAVPFGAQRNGLILGSGATAFVVEAEAQVLARGMQPLAELVAAEFANSAYHGTRLDPPSITRFLTGVVDAFAPAPTAEARAGVAEQTLFLSHETYTPARGGSAAAEIDSLRSIFGAAAKKVVIANTKGFTGHPMGASFEDLVAIKGLQRGQLPPIANFKRPDPAFADLKFADGTAVDAEYAVRFAAGFGSQVAACAYRRRARTEGRLVDEAAFAAWCQAQGIAADAGFEVHKRTLRVAATGGVPLSSLGVPSLTAPQAVAASVAAPATAQASRPSAEVAVAGATVKRPAVTAAFDAAPARPAAAAQPSRAVLLAELTALFAEQTGYDVSELAPDHALEADLGIDSVKQAEILAMVRQRYAVAEGSQVDAAALQTLAAITDWLLTQRQGAAAAAAAADSDDATAGAVQVADVAATAPVPQAADAAAAKTAAPQHAPAPAANRDQLLAELTALFAEQTGYDEAELAPDHALEADLGIDSVKQAEILAMVRTRYGVAADVPFKLSELETLSALSNWLAEQQAPSGGAAGANQTSVAPAAATPPTDSVPSAGGVPLTDSAPSTAGLLQELTQLFAQETGYDVADLAPDHALEADLGIDSVKQAEILAIVRERYGLQAQAPFKLGEVSTLAALADAVAEARSANKGLAKGPTTAPNPPPTGTAPQAVDERVVGEAAAAVLGDFRARQVVLLPVARPRPTAAAQAPGWLGRVTLHSDDQAAAQQATQALQGTATSVTVVAFDAKVDDAPDTSLWLNAPGVAAALFAQAQTWAKAEKRPQRLAVIGCNAHGYGLVERGDGAAARALAAASGLLKSLAKEWPESRVLSGDCVLSTPGTDVGATSAAAPGWQVATAAVLAALAAPATDWPYLEAVALLPARAGTSASLTPATAPASAEQGALAGGLHAQNLSQALWAAPARSPVTVAPKAAPLAAHTRVVVTGGARGITYALLHRLAARRPLDVTILARTQGQAPKDSLLTGRDDEGRKALAKATLAAAGEKTTPAAVRAWLAGQEAKLAIHANLEALRQLGCTVRLLVCDVACPAARARAIAELQADARPIGLLLHGAGLEESRRIEDKTADAWQRTCAPKVAALRHLVAELRPGRWVSMGSIAGRFGNAAQTDYAGANEALAAEARLAGDAGLNLGWTAWAGLGMAERGSVRRILEAGGVALVPSDKGVALGVDLIESTACGDVVVAAGLGAMAHGEAREAAFFSDGGIAVNEAPCLRFTRTFDPTRDVGLDHHRIDGVAVLPGVLGVELMVRAASAVVGRKVDYLEQVTFAAPVKFFHDRPLAVDVEVRTEGNGLALAVCTTFVGPRGGSKRRVHFRAMLPATVPPRPPKLTQPTTAFGAVRHQPTMTRSAIYARYFHGPTFQVLADAPTLADAGITAALAPPAGGWLADGADADFVSAPYAREAGFQAAGLHEMAEDGRMALPAAIAALWLGDDAAAAGAVALGEAEPAASSPAAAAGTDGRGTIVARRLATATDGACFDVEFQRSNGATDVMRGYRTVVLRPLTAQEQLHVGGTGEGGPSDLRSPSEAADASTSVPSSSSSSSSSQALASAGTDAGRELLSLRETAQLLAPGQEEALAYYLSPAERQRLAQFPAKKRREDWLGGRLAAKALLRRTWPTAEARPDWAEMTIAADANGEPELLLAADVAKRHPIQGRPRLSLSHSGDIVAAVVSWNGDRLIGIDVERVARRDDSFARTYFTAAEQAWARASSAPARAHTILWAVKEAALKALSVVAQVDLRSLVVHPNDARTNDVTQAYRLELTGEAAQAAERRRLAVHTVTVELHGQQVLAEVTFVRRPPKRASDPTRRGSPSTEAARMQ